MRLDKVPLEEVKQLAKELPSNIRFHSEEEFVGDEHIQSVYILKGLTVGQVQKIIEMFKEGSW